MQKIFKIKSEVWIYPSSFAAWHFVSVPKKETKIISDRFKGLNRGWGSLPVEVSLGKTKWRTSIFPDKRSETYLLPLKSEVRRKEKIFDKDIINFSIKILV